MKGREERVLGKSLSRNLEKLVERNFSLRETVSKGGSFEWEDH
jgi:hypothetical protein